MIHRIHTVLCAAIAASWLLTAGPALAAPAFRFAFGGDGPGNGQFSAAQGIAIDPLTGNVYVTDQSGNRVQKFDAQGNYLMQWGSTGNGAGQFNFPLGIAIDGAGNVYVCEILNSRVQKFDANGNYLGQWGTFGSGNGQFSEPIGIAINAAGEIYVVEQAGSRVQKFTAAGAYVTKWGTLGTAPGQFQNPRDVAVDGAGNVYVCDRSNHRIQKFNATGAFLLAWGGPGTGNGQFSSPAGLGIDAAGEIYVAEFTGGRVQKFRSDGTFLTRWNSGGAGAFAQVADVAARGYVYVMDTGWDRVQVFSLSATGLVVTDVPLDQGGQVRLRFSPASNDGPGMPEPVTGYEAYRRVGAAGAPADPSSELHLAGWDYVASIPAHGETEYNVVLPTLVNSTPELAANSVFLVRATTADRYVFIDSDPDSGASVDNLAPAVPMNFRVNQVLAGGAVELAWDSSDELDFERFDLHRSTDPGFVPSAGTLLTALTATTFTDPQGVTLGAPVYYRLAARDHAGNQGEFANANTAITGAGGIPAAALVLHPIEPNPATDIARLRFDLPRAGSVSLEILDVRGRRVWQGARGAAFPPGTSATTWNLRDAAGRRVPAGYYVARLLTAQGLRTAPVIVRE